MLLLGIFFFMHILQGAFNNKLNKTAITHMEEINT